MASSKYKVVVEQTAIQDILEYAEYIRDQEAGNAAAARWVDELETSVSELATMPRRFHVIDEQELFQIELRQFTYHSHRVIFHVNEATLSVHVLRVYHSGRNNLHLS